MTVRDRCRFSIPRTSGGAVGLRSGLVDRAGLHVRWYEVGGRNVPATGQVHVPGGGGRTAGAGSARDDQR